MDDNQTNLDVIAAYFTEFKLWFDMTQKAEETLPLLRKGIYDQKPYRLVILDYMMPGKNGADIGREIQSDSDLKDIHLVMLKSFGQKGDVKKFEQIGFDAYMTKPLKYQQLYNCIMSVFQKKNVLAHGAPSSKMITRFTFNDEQKRRIKILVAEDNIVNQKLALRLLEKWGLDADAVGHGKEAIDALAMIPYDLVLMDVEMPEMDGLTATRLIRDNQTDCINRDVPIIAMTARAMKGDQKKCVTAGMNDYITKPINPEKLMEAIANQL